MSKTKPPPVSKPLSKVAAVPLPEYVFRIVSRGRAYYYFQRRRGHSDAGPRIRLPEPNSPEWFAALAAATKDKRSHAAGTMSSVWEAYLGGARGPKTEGTKKTYSAAWRVIEPIWGDLPPAKITPKAIGELHDGLASRARMANLVLTVTRLLLEEAKRLGMVSSNVAAGMRPHEIDDVDGAKPLTAAAWAALMAPECPRPVYRLAILGRATGQRISDLVTLCPAMRERDGFRHAIKKRQRRVKDFWSQVAPGYLKTIDGWQGFPAAPFVHVDGRANEAKLRELWRSYAATEAGSALAGFSPHDLRATNFCDHILGGMTPDDIARLRGVSVEKVLQYTQHLRTEDFADALRGRTGTKRARVKHSTVFQKG